MRDNILLVAWQTADRQRIGFDYYKNEHASWGKLQQV